MRKEYNDRWNSPLVNPAFTIENGVSKPIQVNDDTCAHDAIKLTGKFETECLECPCGFNIPF